HAVARELDDPAAMLAEERLNQLLAVRLEPIKDTTLVSLSQARVANHICRQDGSKAALEVFFGYECCQGRRCRSYWSPVGRFSGTFAWGNYGNIREGSQLPRIDRH